MNYRNLPQPAQSSQNRLRQRLIQRINRRYQTITEPMLIGPLRVEFTRIVDPDAVLDQVAEDIDRKERNTGVRQDEVQHLPYWAELWDSAIGLSLRLVQMAPAWGLRRMSALDLGCGMGLVGAVAATLGVQTMLADIETDALLFARLNTVRTLDRARVRQVNWQADRLGEQFDLILGADILYDRSQWEFLDDFWRAHLAPGGQVLLGEPGRQTGEAFINWITARGWTFGATSQPAPPRPKPVRIFELTR